MTSSIKSADDLIVQTENQKLGIVAAEPAKEIKPQKAELPESDSNKEPKSEDEQALDQKESEPKEEASEQKLEPQEKPKEESSSDESSDDETDDYGNPIGKGKTYTEAEVQAMIRDRLKRGSHTEQPQVQDAVKDFKADPNSEESWESQLEGFIEKTISKITTKQQDLQWKQKEEASQAEFEDKFTSGMGKYNDFRDVVGNKPITNSMMMAARTMQDPAAFIYAACKQHPGEIERISKIQDSIAQIAEVGRLEERMKKARTITKAPAPAKKVTGDASHELPKRSIDQLINEHAKTRIMNRR